MDSASQHHLWANSIHILKAKYFFFGLFVIVEDAMLNRWGCGRGLNVWKVHRCSREYFLAQLNNFDLYSQSSVDLKILLTWDWVTYYKSFSSSLFSSSLPISFFHLFYMLQHMITQYHHTLFYVCSVSLSEIMSSDYHRMIIRNMRKSSCERSAWFIYNQPITI